MPTLALLDGHSLAYRAFYALPPDLATRSGQVTNAVYGFTSMLIKLIGDHAPDGLVVTWDVGRTTFRTEEYPEYKAQRRSTPDRFRTQLPLIREVLDAMQIVQVEQAGYEADDVIASLVRQAERDGWDVLVVTGDRDSFQLVDSKVKVVYTRRGISDTVLVDPEWVEKKYGVRPDQYLDYAALRGDTSDNLPGVPGVGVKTAARLVSTYGDLDGVYRNIDKLTPRLRQNLKTYRDRVFRNRSLMGLVDDLDLGLEDDRMRRAELDREATKTVFDRLEFSTLWTRLMENEDGIPEPAGVSIAVDIRVAQTPEGVARAQVSAGMVLEPVYDAGALAGLVIVGEVDPEGEPGDGSAEEAFFVPVPYLEHLREPLADPSVPVSSYDAKQLFRELIERGYTLSGLIFDPVLAGYIIDPAARSESLEDLASKYVGLDLSGASSDEGDSGQGMLDFGGGPDLEGAGSRVVATRMLRPVMEAELARRGQMDLFRKMELPLVPVLARMELAGILVDTTYLEGLGDSLREELAGLESGIHELAGSAFNINSTLQLRKVLFDVLGLPVFKKTPKGAPSTDASVLAKLEEAHPIVARLLRYREIEKLRSTYVDGYLPLVAPDGRIHARFNQTGAATGRLSSDRPNMQNIPVRSETGRTIRRAFVAPEGYGFVVADYSQIELRILAHLSKDPGLLEAFSEGQDIHTATAARVFGASPDQVDADLRRRAKAINFGLLYGMEAFGLADRLKISRDEAREHMDTYFRQFPNVREFLRSVVTEARRNGYTTTLFGRRRYLPELASDNYRIRQMGERMALNAPVQGSAADVIKMAMIELERCLPADSSRMLLQVHDELVLEVARDSIEETARLVRSVMEGVVVLDVPLTVEIALGSNLAAVKG
ncbi:MAG: DNA polymerase I [bacterium]|nr:DNA polymerase I [bacterium]